MDLLQIIDDIGPGFAEGAAERDATDTFVADHYPILRERGVITALIPTELGGGGVSHSELCAALRRLAHYCPSTALAQSMHQHLVAANLWKHLHGKGGTATLEKVAAKKLVLISTGARDWLDSNGTMERVEGGYRYTARKAFASGGPAGDVLVTTGPFEDEVLHFPVPMSREGVSIQHDWKAHGMRATGSNTVVLDNVFIPDESVVMRRARGPFHPAYNVVLTVALPLITSAYVGIAEHAVELALDRARPRRDDPVVQSLTGQMLNHLAVAQLAGDSLVALANDLQFAPELERSSAILVRKTLATQSAVKTVEAAISLVGGAGFYRKTGLERLLRDARAGDFHPLPRARQEVFSGKVALGLPPV
jgi:alkylation response protein AidB-like acyl-CoA dehydrogenase